MTALRRLRRAPLSVVALAYLAGLVVAVAAAPLLAPYDPTAIDLDHVLSTPSREHLLGADMLGRDVLSRLMHGGRASLWGVLQAVATVMALGVPLGLAAGFAGGFVDRSVTVLTDIVLAIPVVVTLLVVLSVFGSNQTAAMVALGVLGAPTVARVVRSVALAAVREPWVAAARVTGLRGVTIVARHLLPRVAGPVIVQVSIFAGVALIAETGLGYLGLGTQPPAPTWGGMVSEASFVIDRQPWLLVPSGVVIGLTVVAFGLVGDLLRDAMTTRFSDGPATVTTPARSGPTVPAPVVAPGSLLSVRDLDIQVGSGPRPSTVVESAWLDIDHGEIVGLLGESGCGKTMTGRAVLGLLPRGARMTRGRIVLGGNDMRRPGAWAGRRGSEVAFVAQRSDDGLDPCYRVGDQIAELVGRSAVDQRERVRELLRSVNLDDDVAGRFPHELSGGMAQRVAIAMALAKRPRLLIADEPTTALDTSVQAEILDLLRRLRDESGVSILLITHDWGVVADICDRAYVMYAGHVVETATATVLMGQPRHPYTVGLLGSMVQGFAPRERLTAIPGAVPDPREWPTGCHFQPRCPLAIAACAAGPIPVAQPEPGHLTRCLRHEIVVGHDQVGRMAAHAA